MDCALWCVPETVIVEKILLYGLIEGNLNVKSVFNFSMTHTYFRDLCDKVVDIWLKQNNKYLSNKMDCYYQRGMKKIAYSFIGLARMVESRKARGPAELTLDKNRQIDAAMEANSGWFEENYPHLSSYDIISLRGGLRLWHDMIDLILAIYQKKALQRVHFFSSRVYEAIESYENVNTDRVTARLNMDIWTSEDSVGYNIFSCEKILFPVYIGMSLASCINHWALAIINMRDRQIEYYCSLHFRNKRDINNEANAILGHLYNWLCTEYQRLNHESLDFSEWKKIIYDDTIPQHHKDFDSGFFTCTLAEYCSRDEQILFTGDEMPFLRRLCVANILKAGDELNESI